VISDGRIGPFRARTQRAFARPCVKAALVLFGAPASLCSALRCLDSGLAALEMQPSAATLPQIMTRSVKETNS
jgi:hypothetical protein